MFKHHHRRKNEGTRINDILICVLRRRTVRRLKQRDAVADIAEGEEFGQWIQREAPTVMTQAEQNVAGDSLDGFLHLAHNRWKQGAREKEKEQTRSDAVGAVKSVQRTQREAARAASAAPVSPKKQAAGSPDEGKLSDLKPEDVSSLVRQSVEQYKR